MIPEATIPDEGDRHGEPDPGDAPELGDTLSAGTGATLIAAGPWEPGDRSSYSRRPVIALRDHHDPYAVWWEVYADDRDEPHFSYYRGGYHGTLAGAFSDWMERVRHALDRAEEVGS